MKPATQPRRPAVGARDAVLRCVRVALAQLRERSGLPANDAPLHCGAPRAIVQR